MWNLWYAVLGFRCTWCCAGWPNISTPVSLIQRIVCRDFCGLFKCNFANPSHTVIFSLERKGCCLATLLWWEWVAVFPTLSHSTQEFRKVTYLSLWSATFTPMTVWPNRAPISFHCKVYWWYSGLHLQQWWDSLHLGERQPGTVVSGELPPTEYKQN